MLKWHEHSDYQVNNQKEDSHHKIEWVDTFLFVLLNSMRNYYSFCFPVDTL